MRQPRSYGFRARVPFHPVGESMTEQAHADAQDVNNIVARFQHTGYLPPSEPFQFADVTDLQGDLLGRIQFAQNVFDRVAASQREAPPPEAAPSDPVQPAP